MRKRLAFAALLSILSFVPSPADYTNLEATVFAIAGDHITIRVHNTISTGTNARVGITVVLDDGTSQSLMSSGFAVLGNATTYVTLTASRPILSKGDGPDPFPW